MTEKNEQDERLEELGEQIDAAKEHARDIIDPPEREYVESGDRQSERADDQTIAPPG